MHAHTASGGSSDSLASSEVAPTTMPISVWIEVFVDASVCLQNEDIQVSYMLTRPSQQPQLPLLLPSTAHQCCRKLNRH